MKKLIFSLHLRQNITSKLNWFENMFSACRLEDVFSELVSFTTAFWRFENGFMDAMMGTMGTIVPIY